MIVTLLGTGTSQGVPVIGCSCAVCSSKDPRDRRLRSSALVSSGDTTLVIDTGPDFRQQMLSAGLTRLDAVLLTHGHKDHIGGLDDVRAFNYLQNRPMDVFARAEVLRTIRREYDYAFARDKYPGVPQIKPHPIGDKPFEAGRMEVIPVTAMHSFLKVTGYRTGSFAYLTDVSSIHDKQKKKLLGLDVLIINALREKMHHSHFNLSQALDLIGETSPKKAWLTHISHMMGCHAEVEQRLPENVKLGYDGLKIEI